MYFVYKRSILQVWNRENIYWTIETLYPLFSKRFYTLYFYFYLYICCKVCIQLHIFFLRVQYTFLLAKYRIQPLRTPYWKSRVVFFAVEKIHLSRTIQRSVCLYVSKYNIFLWQILYVVYFLYLALPCILYASRIFIQQSLPFLLLSLQFRNMEYLLFPLCNECVYMCGVFFLPLSFSFFFLQKVAHVFFFPPPNVGYFSRCRYLLYRHIFLSSAKSRRLFLPLPMYILCRKQYIGWILLSLVPLCWFLGWAKYCFAILRFRIATKWREHVFFLHSSKKVYSKYWTTAKTKLCDTCSCNPIYIFLSGGNNNSSQLSRSRMSIPTKVYLFLWSVYKYTTSIYCFCKVLPLHSRRLYAKEVLSLHRSPCILQYFSSIFQRISSTTTIYGYLYPRNPSCFGFRMFERFSKMSVWTSDIVCEVSTKGILHSSCLELANNLVVYLVSHKQTPIFVYQCTNVVSYTLCIVQYGFPTVFVFVSLPSTTSGKQVVYEFASIQSTRKVLRIVDRIYSICRSFQETLYTWKKFSRFLYRILGKIYFCNEYSNYSLLVLQSICIFFFGVVCLQPSLSRLSICSFLYLAYCTTNSASRVRSRRFLDGNVVFLVYIYGRSKYSSYRTNSSSGCTRRFFEPNPSSARFHLFFSTISKYIHIVYESIYSFQWLQVCWSEISSKIIYFGYIRNEVAVERVLEQYVVGNIAHRQCFCSKFVLFFFLHFLLFELFVFPQTEIGTKDLFGTSRLLLSLGKKLGVPFRFAESWLFSFCFCESCVRWCFAKVGCFLPFRESWVFLGVSRKLGVPRCFEKVGCSFPFRESWVFFRCFCARFGCSFLFWQGWQQEQCRTPFPQKIRGWGTFFQLYIRRMLEKRSKQWSNRNHFLPVCNRFLSTQSLPQSFPQFLIQKTKKTHKYYLFPTALLQVIFFQHCVYIIAFNDFVHFLPSLGFSRSWCGYFVNFQIFT